MLPASHPAKGSGEGKGGVRRPQRAQRREAPGAGGAAGLAATRPRTSLGIARHRSRTLEQPGKDKHPANLERVRAGCFGAQPRAGWGRSREDPLGAAPAHPSPRRSSQKGTSFPKVKR